MSIGRNHVMASNQRLLRQIIHDLYGQATENWYKIYAEFCKRHGELMPNRVMQFKYKATTYHLKNDVMLRSGVQQLHPSLVNEFQEAYQMFVADVMDEQRILQNMTAHAFRIAKYAEDLLELLPECMHAAINESGYFQLDSKPNMSIDDVYEYKKLYEQHFGLFDMRVFLGATM